MVHLLQAETAEDSYDTAALSVITSIVAGLEVRFWDTNGDGYTDLIDADYLEGVTVDTITENANGTYSTPYEGTIFDADRFAGSGIVIEAANFDATIKSGDVGLFWYGPSGWAMERALEINGLFVDGADHTFYDIAGVTYKDAMLFSRDNLFISNRPGEFTDTQKFFGLTKDTAAGLNVSLWLVPVSDVSEFGGPVGMTTAGNSAAFLTRAVAQIQAELANVTVSADGSDVSSTKEWVTQAVYTQLDDAIARANSALSSANSSSFILDYQTYLLYLNLYGGAHNIGAAYAGFNFTGFQNEEQFGSA
ncbi:hypothetical protein EAF00_000818 [Botryotinia globosa]|nr:hypothetical protein EAF00_000818 [Botryotinia globosa]